MSEKPKVVHLNTDEADTTEHLVDFVDFGGEVIWDKPLHPLSTFRNHF